MNFNGNKLSVDLWGDMLQSDRLLLYVPKLQTGVESPGREGVIRCIDHFDGQGRVCM